MKYRKLDRRWKYQLLEKETFDTGVKPVGPGFRCDWFELNEAGNLTLYRGFAWDGATGLPVTPEPLLGPSAAHDAGYQMLAEGFLPKDRREEIDRMLVRLYLERGGSRWFSKVVYAAVRGVGWALIRRKAPGTDLALEAP